MPSSDDDRDAKRVDARAPPGDARRLAASNPNARTLDKLFRNIERPVEFAARGGSAVRPPPELVRNVPSSSAGAGSGEFHIYRALRRKEQTRVAEIERDQQREADRAAFDERKRARDAEDARRTERNRAKRLKKKAKAKSKSAPEDKAEEAKDEGEGRQEQGEDSSAAEEPKSPAGRASASPRRD